MPTRVPKRTQIPPNPHRSLHAAKSEFQLGEYPLPQHSTPVVPSIKLTVVCLVFVGTAGRRAEGDRHCGARPVSSARPVPLRDVDVSPPAGQAAVRGEAVLKVRLSYVTQRGNHCSQRLRQVPTGKEYDTSSIHKS